MTGREYRDAIEAELERAGIGDREFQYGGKHPRVVFVFNGKRCAHGYPSTPSDAVRGLAQNIAGGGLARCRKPAGHELLRYRREIAEKRPC